MNAIVKTFLVFMQNLMYLQCFPVAPLDTPEKSLVLCSLHTYLYIFIPPRIYTYLDISLSLPFSRLNSRSLSAFLMPDASIP